jgi:hypothetical protein
VITVGPQFASAGLDYYQIHACELITKCVKSMLAKLFWCSRLKLPGMHEISVAVFANMGSLVLMSETT